jgi:hypothetical protein
MSLDKIFITNINLESNRSNSNCVSWECGLREDSDKKIIVFRVALALLILSFLIILFYLMESRGFYLWIYRQLVGLLRQVIGPMQGLYLHTGQYNTEKRRHTSMPRAGFEPVIWTFEQSKTVLASDCSVIETGWSYSYADKTRGS